MEKFVTKWTVLTLFFSLTQFSFAAQAESTSSSEPLIPVILTLAITDEKKNDAPAIAEHQDKVIASLKDFHTAQIKRYRYTPLLALSIEQAGLDFLNTSSDIVAITLDGVSAPLNPKKSSSTTPCDES